jgi:hypothetical protein
MRYDTCPFEHLELFYEGKSEENFQPPQCLDFDEHSCVKSIVFKSDLSELG